VKGTMGETRKLAAIMAVDVVGYSRLMSEDEAGTARAVREHRRAAVPIVASLGGRVVKTMGDGLLLEFPSVVSAVECAVTIQSMMAARNVGTPEVRRVVYRIGVHLGDVLIDGDDILGEGVNIAARLESICEPGGVSISRAVYDQISGKLALGFRTLGLQKLKNIAKAVEVFAIDYMDKTDDARTLDDASLAQRVKYCRAPDGVRLAYAISGSGPPLVKTGNWMNHLEYDWESPIWRHVFRGLSRNHTLIRYDARGNGLSDWDVDTLSLDAWVTDLEKVVNAAGIERFPLLGMSQGGAISVAYTVRHAERVTHLILYGAFALGGRKRSPAECRFAIHDGTVGS
jgi:class 3 adenylate cyclase